jgi:hypothetical protein
LKKNLSILILFLFVYNSFGFLAVHPFLSIYYKNSGLRQADEPSGNILIEKKIFNRDDIEENRIDFRWIHSREFKYNGEMYDIVRKEESDKQLILYCINDKKEKKLEEEFAKKVNENSKNSKQKQTSFHLNILLSEPAQIEKINFARSRGIKFNLFSSYNYNSVQLDIPSPPPRFV